MPTPDCQQAERTRPTSGHTSKPQKAKLIPFLKTHSLPEESPWRRAGGSYRCTDHPGGRLRQARNTYRASASFIAWQRSRPCSSLVDKDDPLLGSRGCRFVRRRLGDARGQDLEVGATPALGEAHQPARAPSWPCRRPQLPARPPGRSRSGSARNSALDSPAWASKSTLADESWSAAPATCCGQD